MQLPRKLTQKEEALRAELVKLEERCRLKIRQITYENKKLPFERLAKGRIIKEHLLLAIDFLDKGEKRNLEDALERLESLGLKIKI